MTILARTLEGPSTTQSKTNPSFAYFMHRCHWTGSVTCLFSSFGISDLLVYWVKVSYRFRMYVGEYFNARHLKLIFIKLFPQRLCSSSHEAAMERCRYRQLQSSSYQAIRTEDGSCIINPCCSSTQYYLIKVAYLSFAINISDFSYLSILHCHIQLVHHVFDFFNISSNHHGLHCKWLIYGFLHTLAS